MLRFLPLVLVGCATAPKPITPKAVTPKPAPSVVVPSTPPGKYPMRFVPIAASEIAVREKAFRARNPEPWTKVEFDAYGYLYDARIVQPTPNAMPKPPEYDDAQMKKDWGAFVERNRDVLGADYPGMVPVDDKRAVGFRQTWGPHTIGFAQVSWHGVGYSNGTWSPASISVAGHGWPVNVPYAKERTDDELAAPWVGLKGTLSTTYQAILQPCDPPGGGKYNPCANRKLPVPPPPKKEPYTLSRDEVLVQRSVCRYHAPGDDALEIRIAALVSVRARVTQTSAGDGIVGMSGFSSSSLPLRSRVDAVTGESLDTGKCD